MQKFQYSVETRQLGVPQVDDFRFVVNKNGSKVMSTGKMREFCGYVLSLTTCLKYVFYISFFVIKVSSNTLHLAAKQR